jgi:hypothetical protein
MTVGSELLSETFNVYIFFTIIEPMPSGSLRHCIWMANILNSLGKTYLDDPSIPMLTFGNAWLHNALSINTDNY